MKRYKLFNAFSDIFHGCKNSIRWIATFISLLLATAACAATTPTSDFIDNADGTVTHKVTGLTWKRCAEGQTWSAGTCLGNATKHSRSQALALAVGEWRLPTIAELATIVDRDAYDPAINAMLFPNTPLMNPALSTQSASAPEFFWSSSPSAANPSSASGWVVFFSTGKHNEVPKEDDNCFSASCPPAAYRSGHIRMVRGGPTPDVSALSTPSSDFVDNGDGSVTHKKTNLTWKRCIEGHTWAGAACSGTSKSYTLEQAMALETGGWRLPTINELLSIVEWRTTAPAINRTIFPMVAPTGYWSSSQPFWSSTKFSGVSGDYWAIGLDDGKAVNSFPSWYQPVLLVRGAQPLTTSADCVFNWAETSFPAVLSPKVSSGWLDVYYYRAYPAGYLAVSSSNNHTYFLAAAPGSVVNDLGLLSTFLAPAGCR